MKQLSPKCIALLVSLILCTTLACTTLFPKTQDQQSAPPTPPAKINKDYVPDTSNLTIEKIQLPKISEIPLDQQRALANLIVKVDIAEILAIYYQDDSYLKPYNAGDELQELQLWIERIRQSGQIVVLNIDLSRSYYVSMYLKGGILSVDACEYWQDYYYDSNGNLVDKEEWHLVPQTMSFETIGDRMYETAVSFYSNKAFCK
jgi:hypothetical protein